MTRRVIDAMTADIPLPSALHHIMSAPAYSSGRFGEMKNLLLGMLDTYNYERTLLNTCARLVNQDLYGQLARLTAASGRGIALKRNSCTLCGKGFSTGGVVGWGNRSVREDREMVVCFHCGHGYHSTCLVMVGGGEKTVGGSLGVPRESIGEQIWLCVACKKTRGSTGLSGGRVRLSSYSCVAGTTATNGAAANPGGPRGARVETVGSLQPAHVAAIDSLRRGQRTQSRFAILTELSKSDRAGSSGGGLFRYQPNVGGDVGGSVLQNEGFSLRLTPRPANES